MKKVLLFIVLLAIAISAGAVYVLANPPLVGGAVYSTPDKKTVLVSVGNDGLKGVIFDKVSVNGGLEPLTTAVQISNALKGFFISPEFEDIDAPFEFEMKGLDETTIPRDTNPVDVYLKQDTEPATSENKIYGIGVTYEQEVREVTIHYRYFGMPLTKTVES